MHELTRRIYLDTLGIQTYVSRAQAPGSAMTRKLAVARVVSNISSRSTASATTPILTEADSAATNKSGIATNIPSFEFESRVPSAPAPVASLASSARDGLSPRVEFSIVAWTAGGWLWLEELPSGQAVMRDQLQLVKAMVSALGWGAGKPDMAQFNWPIYNNQQLDSGEGAARAALGGFINRKLEQSASRGLVLLGSQCAHWVQLDQIDTEHRILTVSTSEMLHSPSMKKRAWRDLQTYAHPK